MGVTILPGRATTAHLGLVRIANGLQVDTAGNLSVNLASSDIPNLAASKITTGQLATARGGTGIDSSAVTDGQLLIGRSSDNTFGLAALTAGSGVSITNAGHGITIAATGSGGTVSSVALSLPSIFSVSGSPVTGAGTLAGSLATQVANSVFSGPSTGADATPTFRALDPADIPNLNASKITAGTLALARGGTNTDGSSVTANTVFSGPTSGGAASAAFRALVAGDIPNLAASIITSGTLALARGGTNTDNSSVTANTVWSGPSSGGAASAAYRALVAADIPSLDTGKITTGTLALARLSGITTSQLDSAAGIVSGQITSLAASKITGSNTLPDGVLSTNVPLLNAANTFTALQTATAFAPTGLTGSTAATRYVGGTTSGAPASGAHNKGDWAITQDGSIYICTTAGTPGTWTAVSGGGGGFTSPLTTKGDVHAYSTTDARVAVGADGTFLSADSSQATGLAYKFPAGVAGVSTLSMALSANVALTSANTYYDGPSLSLTAGTWLLVGSILAKTNAGAATTNVTAKLWDGTTVYASAQNVCFNDTAVVDTALCAIVTPTTTTTYKISAASQQTGCNIVAAAPVNGAGNNASFLQAVQLTGAPASGPGALMPAVRCYNSANISVATSGTPQALTFDTNRFDQGTSTAQHSTSSLTSRLTCQQAGIYEIWGLVSFASNATGIREASLRLNGTTTIADSVVASSNTSNQTVPVSCTYQLAVGDYVELMANQTSGGALNATAVGNYSPEFGMARIDSGPGAVQPNTRVQLDYQANTDIAAGVSISASTWTDIGSNQTFTVDDVNSVVEIAVSGMALGFNGAANTDWGVRINVDSGGTPITRMIGGGRQAAGSIYMNILSGMGTIDLTGLTAGSHTVKVQLYASQSGTFYCQPAASPNLYNFSIRVLERKQSSSPPSSTPAPAVRCYNSANISCSNNTDTLLTFDTNRVDQGVSTAQHSTSSNTGRLTCQQAGMYQITAAARFAANSTGMRRLDLLLNGTTNIGSSTVPQAGSDVLFVNVSTLYQLVVGDYVIVNAVQDSGGSLNVVADGNRSPEFMMCRVDSGGQGFVPIPILKTANYTILNSDCLVVAGAGSLTFTLPAASSRAPGMPIVVKNDNFTSTTIARAGSDTIDGATSYSLPGAYSSITLVGDGVSVWRAI